MILQDLGTLPYRLAWRRQEEVHAQVLAGGEECLLLVEHPPVITFGRRVNPKNLLANAQSLAQAGVEVVESDRGGDITIHAPGQLIAYPIIRLADHNLSVGGYVKRLQFAVINALAEFAIPAQLDPSAVGVWVDQGNEMKKICAVGVRIKRGVSMHGIALNVSTDLRYFNLIVPCGLESKGVTSMSQILGKPMNMDQVKAALARTLTKCLSPHSDF